jgi:hypothetical protein
MAVLHISSHQSRLGCVHRLLKRLDMLPTSHQSMDVPPWIELKLAIFLCTSCSIFDQKGPETFSIHQVQQPSQNQSVVPCVISSWQPKICVSPFAMDIKRRCFLTDIFTLSVQYIEYHTEYIDEINSRHKQRPLASENCLAASCGHMARWRINRRAPACRESVP